MNIALLRAITVKEYLALSNVQGDRPRSELINGQIVAMSPERADHNRSKLATCMALIRAVKEAGLPCEVFTDGMTVPVDAYTAYEPDALVHCGAPIAPEQLVVPAPLIVVEVISPTSAHSDTSAKLIGYFRLASVRHYLLVDPRARAVTHHARDAAGAMSVQTLSSGTLRLDPPGFDIDVADILR